MRTTFVERDFLQIIAVTESPEWRPTVTLEHIAANEDLVKAYANICFDDCFVVNDIRAIKGPTGLFISFPNRTHSEGGQRDIAFPVNVKRGI